MEHWLRMVGYSPEEAYFERLNQELLAKLRERGQGAPPDDQAEEEEDIPPEEEWKHTG